MKADEREKKARGHDENMISSSFGISLYPPGRELESPSASCHPIPQISSSAAFLVAGIIASHSRTLQHNRLT